MNATNIAAQFEITYLPELDKFRVCCPTARRGTDRQGTVVPDEPAVLAWCVRTWEINRGRA
jgi:hypothetical protein